MTADDNRRYSIFRPSVTVADDGTIEVDFSDAYESTTTGDETVSEEPDGQPHSGLLDQVLGTGGAADKLRRLANHIAKGTSE